MDILIKGMEMPMSCWGCPFSVHYDPDTDRCLVTEKLFEANWARFNDRLPDCPLVPVPPHGRLIDADALVAEFHRLTLGENSLIEKFFADGVYAEIDTAPTIIPAEEGE